MNDFDADIYKPLFEDILEEDQFYNKNPYLAHYTSLDVFEQILRNDEVWFSNPLFMNDEEELKFGIVKGAQHFKESQKIKEALGTSERHSRFVSAFDHYLYEFDEKHLLDTYVFCLSEHKPDDQDGRLSMWRGYGQNGNGVAIVFDSSKLGVRENSPLIISKVEYGSSELRMQWFEKAASTTADIIVGTEIEDDSIYQIAWALFERLKLFALFTKHIGFEEEQEWRAVYLSDRDKDGILRPMLDYRNGQRGIEPILKFKVLPNNGLSSDDFSFTEIVSSIILGPTTNSELAFRSVERMLELIGKPEMKEQLVASSIPFRP